MALSRRELIRRAGMVAAVSAVSQQFFPRTDALAAPIGADAPTGEFTTPFTMFSEAQVQSVQASSIKAIDSNGRPLEVFVTDVTTEIWRGGPASLSDVEPGDFFYARGLPLGDQQMAAANIWFNIVNVFGDVLVADDQGCQLQSNIDIPVRYSNQTTLFLPGTVTPLSGLSLVAKGMSVQVLGMKDPKSGQLLATRIWLHG